MESCVLRAFHGVVEESSAEVAQRGVFQEPRAKSI
jgi:hypothetical protein